MPYLIALYALKERSYSQPLRYVSLFIISRRFTSIAVVVFTSVVFLALIFSAPAFAQDCTPDDITLSNQAEVNEFQINHGPCDTITGDLKISGKDIVDLSPLSALTTVVGGDFFGGGIYIWGNTALANLKGLSALSTVDGWLQIFNNAALKDLDGLSALTSVHYFDIQNNTTLANLDGLSALTTVDGWLNIKYNNALTNLNGLSALTSAVNMEIWSNVTLANLDGLSTLTTVRGSFTIGYNTALTNLDGLSALTNVGNLNISYNTTLANLDGLSALISGRRIEIISNAGLTNLNGLSALISVDPNLSVWDNKSLNDCLGIVMLVDPIDDYEPGPGPGASGIPDVANKVTIQNNLKGCNSVLEIIAEAPLLEINPGLNDAWFNLETNGQGFFINVFPTIKQIFLGWFTYDTERPPEDVTAFIGEPGHRWLTAQGEYEENVAVLEVNMTSGGVFDSEEPASSSEPDGEIMLEFSTCNAGTVTYDIPSVDRQGVIPIERIVLDNVPLCYVLNSEAAELATRQ